MYCGAVHKIVLLFATSILLVMESSCSNKPNHYQQAIINYLSIPSSNIHEWINDSSYYDIDKNEVVFVSIIDLSNTTPAFENTLIEQYKDKKRIRMSTKREFVNLSPILQEMLKIQASARYIIKTNDNRILADNTFSPEEYLTPINEEEEKAIIIANIRQQALSMQVIFPVIIEDGVYIFKADFIESTCVFRFLIVVSDEILSSIRLMDIEEYATEIGNSFVNSITREFPEIVESYRSVGLKIAITMCDVRKNVLCTTVKPI